MCSIREKKKKKKDNSTFQKLPASLEEDMQINNQ